MRCKLPHIAKLRQRDRLRRRELSKIFILSQMVFPAPVKLKLSAHFTLIRFKDIELTRRSAQYSLSDFQSNTLVDI